MKASDVGKIVKRLKKDRKESGDENMDSAYKGLMQNWYEKANKGDDEEEKKFVALEAQARKATEKKKRSAKKRSSAADGRSSFRIAPEEACQSPGRGHGPKQGRAHRGEAAG